jgi:hypothetical protein
LSNAAGEPHARHDGRGRQKSHAGDLGQRLAGGRLAQLLRQASLDEADVGLQLVDPPYLLVEAVDEHRRQPRLGFVQRGGQLLHQRPVPLGQHDAELVEQATHFIGLHDAHLHELRAQTVQRQHDLLAFGLDGDEAHAGLAAGRPDRLRVSRIGLVALHERADLLWREQPHLVAELPKLASPLVGTATGFHHHPGGLPVGEPRQDLGPPELQPLDAAGLGVDPVQLEHVLGDVHRDVSQLHGRPSGLGG